MSGQRLYIDLFSRLANIYQQVLVERGGINFINDTFTEDFSWAYQSNFCILMNNLYYFFIIQI